jgi:hypothetical protein
MKQKLKKDTNRNGNYKNFSDFGWSAKYPN